MKDSPGGNTMTCLTNERTRLISDIDLAVKQKNRIALYSHDVYNCQTRLDTCMPDRGFSGLSVLKTAASLALMYILTVFSSRTVGSAMGDAVLSTVCLSVMIPVTIGCIYCLKNILKCFWGFLLGEIKDEYTDAYAEAYDRYAEECQAFTDTCDDLIIPGEYRNLNALMMIRSYLSEGRCDRLEEAYRIYEDELHGSRSLHE